MNVALVKRIGLLAWAQATAYRPDVVFNSVLFWAPILLNLLLWRTVMRTEGSRELAGYALPQLVTYFSLSVLINRGSNEGRAVSDEILRGDVKRYLPLPVNFAVFRLVFAASNRAARMAQVIPGVALLVVVLHRYLVGPTPIDAMLWMASTALGFVLEFQILFLVGLSAFWIGASALFGITGWAMSLLSGSMFPLDLLPGWAVQLMQWLPFSYTVFYPIGIFLGHVTVTGAFRVLLVQVVWVSVLAVVTNAVWVRGVRTYEAYGG